MCVDFVKAFDSIVLSKQTKLLFKCELYGITRLLFKWISGFLTILCVIIDDCFSPVGLHAVSTGVPRAGSATFYPVRPRPTCMEY
jgi:hypothetical protein